MRKWKHLIWTNDLRLQNFLGERNIWPVEEDDFNNKAGYAPTKEVKEAMDSYEIRRMFYHNHK